jgi:hypothetical protein
MTWNFRKSIAVVLLLMVTAAAGAAQVYANIPAGTSLQVRITEKLSSETASVGDQFHGTLAAPVVANGRTLFAKGSEVTGAVVNVERSGRLSNPGELHLAIQSIRSGRQSYALAASPIVIKGESHTKSNLTKIGGGTAAGAIIGAIAGGGKGAAIGAGVGAAAGTGVAAATGKKAAEVESEAVLSWAASNPPQGASVQGQRYGRSSGSSYAQLHPPSSGDEKQVRSHHDQENEDGKYDDRQPTEFSASERRIISDCFVDNRSGLPPGLAKKDRLPPGLERQLQRNGTLPPGLQKRVQPLPGVCTSRLPRLPRDWARVVLSGRIILLDPVQRIVDMFWLDRDGD